MVPREARRGSSFKGAGLYYLHDKNASTSERVAFTHTENIPTRDPEKALKWMAWTSSHAEELKTRNGDESKAGRKSEADSATPAPFQKQFTLNVELPQFRPHRRIRIALPSMLRGRACSARRPLIVSRHAAEAVVLRTASCGFEQCPATI